MKIYKQIKGIETGTQDKLEANQKEMKKEILGVTTEIEDNKK